jgi:GT2 family glycosyltransferase
MNSPSVTSVILNWNNASDTIECLESVSRMSYPNCRTLVVDNGSTDDSVARIRAAWPAVELLELGGNLGYAEGNNVGIRHALDHRAEYVFVLNNDTLVSSDVMTRLVEVMETDSRIGMAGPKVYCTDPADRIFAEGSLVLWNRGLIKHRGMLQGDTPGRTAVESVDFLVGCGMLVRRALIEEVGLLDPQYYLNYEDVEWSVRARRSGFRVLYVPKAVIWHKVSATLGRASAANTYYMTRNALRFFWRNAPGVARWTATVRIILRTMRTVVAWTLKSEYCTSAFRKKRQANLFALRDFVCGRFGPMGSDVHRSCYGN